MSKIVAIIQARMSSTRLPGKVLLPLGESTVLQQVVNRAKQALLLDDVVVATSTKGSDDKLAEYCQSNHINCFRGSLDNVLSRYYEAALAVKADVIVRITSDCPLYDGKLLQNMLEEFIKLDCDYYSNCHKRSFPRGLDTEIFTLKTLEVAHKNAKNTPQLEHVTPYIYQNPVQFNIKHYVKEPDNSAHRWTLDEPDDYKLIENIYKNLGSKCTSREVLEYLKKHPDIFALNQHIEQKKV